MNQLTVVLVTALVTGVVSISGIWFGSHLTQENEVQKWRRDHALEVYSELVIAVEVAHAESDRMYISEECGTEGHHKQAAVLLERRLGMDRISQRVFLLAPSEVNEHMANLMDHMGKEIITKVMNCPKIEKRERDSTMKKSAELLVVFRNAARNDLGIHPLR